MVKHSLFIFLLLTYTPLVSIGQYWTPPQSIRQIPVPTLNDIALATLDSYGPVIYFNPHITQQVGPLVTAFFEAHEFGHHHLGHVVAGIFNRNNPYIQMWLTLNAENAADEYAVRYHAQKGNKAVLQAVCHFFTNHPNNGDKSHPPSNVRVQNIQRIYSEISGMPLFP